MYACVCVFSNPYSVVHSYVRTSLLTVSSDRGVYSSIVSGDDGLDKAVRPSKFGFLYADDGQVLG